MKKTDFTPEAIEDELSDYTMNQNFPFDELSEIGSKVYITGISDVEVDDVRRSGSIFIVEGSATLETETDIGEGDSFSDSYPMTFTYEFGNDGKIVRQLSRKIDTSSFSDGADDLDEYLIGLSRSSHHPVFQNSVLNIESLVNHQLGSSSQYLRGLLFVNVITALESYLADFFISQIKGDDKLLRNFIETTAKFKDQKITVADVFRTRDTIDKRADTYLVSLVWHRLDVVRKLYERSLGIVLPSDLLTLTNAIKVRHDLVHRNGKRHDGTQHEITEADIKTAIEAAGKLVDHIENRWQERSAVAGSKSLVEEAPFIEP